MVREADERLALLERLNRRWAVLNDVIVRGLRAQTPAELMPLVGAALRDTGLDSYIAFLSADGTHLRPVYTSREPAERAKLRALSGNELLNQLWPLSTMPAFAEAIAAGRPRFVADRRAISRAFWPHRRPDEVDRLASAMGGRHAIIAPLVTSRRVLGTLTVLGDDLIPEDIDPVGALAHQLTGALERLQLLEEARARAEDLEALYRLNRIINSSLDLRQIQLAFGAEFRKLVPFDRGSIRLYEADGRYSRLFGFLTPDQPDLTEAEVVPTARLILRNVYEERKPLIIADVATADSLFTREQMLRSGVRSILCLPLLAGDTVVGSLSLGSSLPGVYRAEMLPRLGPITEQLALAISHAALYEDARRARARAEALADVGRRLASELIDYRRLLQLVAEHACRLCEAAYAFVAIPEGEGFRAAAVAGEAPDYVLTHLLSATPPPPAGDGPVSEALRTLQPVVANDLRRHASAAVREFAAAHGIGSMVALPLLYSGRPVGLLAVHARNRWAFDEKLVAFLESFALQGAVAVENALLYRQLRDSEERYRMVVENAQDLIVSVDRDGRFTFLNGRVVDILGYTPAELIGRPLADLLTAEGQAIAEAHFLDAGADLPHGDVFEIQMVRRDGATVSLEGSAATVFRDGAAVGRQAILRDVTRRKELEERLREMATQRAMGQLAAGVAHDFNNLLGLVLGRTELLLQRLQRGETTAEVIASALAVIRQAAMDGAQTVRRLQEFTRTQPPSAPETLDVNEVLRSAVALTAPRWRDDAQERGLPIEVRVVPGAVPPVAGNAAELREVLTNLIFNALDAMPEGGVIRLESIARGALVEIRVTDTGTGMPEAVRRQVFEPFFTTKGTRGSGLGLSMARTIVQRHGGTIQVESEQGRGTTFHILLPAGTAPAHPAVAPTPPPTAARTARILAIDDEPGLLQVLRMILEDEGHALTVCASGPEGVAAFQRALAEGDRFELVLTDLGMPGMNGWEVAQAIKAIDPGTPVALITGWGTQLDAEKMRESGIRFVLSKPYHLDEVQQLVARALAPADDGLD